MRPSKTRPRAKKQLSATSYMLSASKHYRKTSQSQKGPATVGRAEWLALVKNRQREWQHVHNVQRSVYRVVALAARPSTWASCRGWPVTVCSKGSIIYQQFLVEDSSVAGFRPGFIVKA